MTAENKQVIKFLFHKSDHEVVKDIGGMPEFHKGMAPNAIHSVDALIAHEMVARCMHNPATVQRVKDLVRVKPYGTGGVSSDMVQTLWHHYEECGFLSVRIMDYLHHDTCGYVDLHKIEEMVESLPSSSFGLLTNHDCFRSHPNYANDVRVQYNEILAQLSESTLLEYILKQMMGEDLVLRKAGVICPHKIRAANYTLS